MSILTSRKNKLRAETSRIHRLCAATQSVDLNAQLQTISSSSTAETMVIWGARLIAKDSYQLSIGQEVMSQ